MANKIEVTLTYKRIHLPSGREYVGTFVAAHDSVFGDPRFVAPIVLEKAKHRLIDHWNRQQPNTWRYYL